jgi:flagellar basal body rod protein FlgC
LLDKAANPSTSKVVAERYEQQAEEYINAQTKQKAELAKVNTLLANIANVQTQFATQRERIKTEEIFISNEISREIVEIFVQQIVVDDINNKINIILKGENL